MDSGLFGIYNSNRSTNKHWGKNCFNSSFPTAMACYMLNNDISAVYIKAEIQDGKLVVVPTTISLRDVFNSGETRLQDLDFHFETMFADYQEYSFDDTRSIDLVVKNTSGEFLRPLEVKLTVLPDNNTSSRSEDRWGSEMVIRSATTSYCALGMFDALKANAATIRDIFEDSCSCIQMWDNDFEMTHKTRGLAECVDAFQKRYYETQKPLLMQTIWKTQGKSPLLADQAFDIIVWSDFAFSRLFIDSSYDTVGTMSRPMRTTARLARCLWELSKSGKIRMRDIYKQMAFGNQTDKEFAIGGSVWKKYVTSERTVAPILHKDAITEIIDPGFIERLSPERRFDQTLYFTIRGN
jgi:hypothetical protein